MASERGSDVDFLEVTPENWLFRGGAARRLFERCVERWPTVSHSVSLSVGGPDPLDGGLLDGVRALSRRIEAPFWSDHLCWSSFGGAPLHELLPLPFTDEAAEHVARRVREAEARVETPLVLENATYYVRMPPDGDSAMGEADFLCATLERAGCGLLLDVNNVYVNAQNHGYDARAFIDRMPLERVRQLHLAGHTVEELALIDTHIGPIPEPVWALYRHTLRRAGRLIPTLIEWDAELPPLAVLLGEVDRARAEATRALDGARAA